MEDTQPVVYSCSHTLVRSIAKNSLLLGIRKWRGQDSPRVKRNKDRTIACGKRQKHLRLVYWWSLPGLEVSWITRVWVPATNFQILYPFGGKANTIKLTKWFLPGSCHGAFNVYMLVTCMARSASVPCTRHIVRAYLTRVIQCASVRDVSWRLCVPYIFISSTKKPLPL